MQVLAHDAVEAVIGVKDALKDGMRHPGYDQKADEQYRYDDDIDQADLPVDGEGHDQGADDGHGGFGGDAQHHHKGVLDVRNIGGHPRHEAVGGEAVDVREGKVLYSVEHRVPEVFGQTGGRLDGLPTADRAEYKA